MNPADFTIERFERLDVDPAAFGHDAHLFVARLYLLRYPEREALRRFRRALQRLTAALGAAGKYHETITRFYIEAVAGRMAARPGDDWTAFRASNPDLFDGSALAASYSKQCLGSVAARRRFVAPDRRQGSANR